ncbi:MAG TPA: hypothetical protein VFJ45_09270 [bacterium]|nr:hypothetical protein [bacterium]
MTDVVGLELDDARGRLAAGGLTVRSVTETRPPQPVELAGPLRVVRVRREGDAVDLVVTRERYVPHVG